MSRCDICGSKECCGADYGPRVETLTARVARLELALRHIREHHRVCSDWQAAEDMTAMARQALEP